MNFLPIEIFLKIQEKCEENQQFQSSANLERVFKDVYNYRHVEKHDDSLTIFERVSTIPSIILDKNLNVTILKKFKNFEKYNSVIYKFNLDIVVIIFFNNLIIYQNNHQVYRSKICFDNKFSIYCFDKIIFVTNFIDKITIYNNEINIENNYNYVKINNNYYDLYQKIKINVEDKEISFLNFNYKYVYGDGKIYGKSFDNIVVIK